MSLGTYLLIWCKVTVERKDTVYRQTTKCSLFIGQHRSIPSVVISYPDLNINTPQDIYQGRFDQIIADYLCYTLVNTMSNKEIKHTKLNYIFISTRVLNKRSIITVITSSVKRVLHLHLSSC